MHYYEQPPSCKRTQLEVRSGPAEHGAFRRRSAPASLRHRSCGHKPTAGGEDRSIKPLLCKVVKGPLASASPQAVSYAVTANPRRANPRGQGLRKPIISWDGTAASGLDSLQMGCGCRCNIRRSFAKQLPAFQHNKTSLTACVR